MNRSTLFRRRLTGTFKGFGLMRVHPSAIIEDGVLLGSNVVIGPFAVIHGGVEIGNNVVIGSHVTIGTAPEIRGNDQVLFTEPPAGHIGVQIGDSCVIREHVTIQRGSRQTTSIGSSTWLLGQAYVAHDVQIGENVTISSGVRLAGHSQAHDWANIGMNATVHQFRVVGAGCMIGMSSSVTKDVPPLAKAFGVPCRIRGVNTHLADKVLESDLELQALTELYSSSAKDIRAALLQEPTLAQNQSISDWLRAL